MKLFKKRSRKPRNKGRSRDREYRKILHISDLHVTDRATSAIWYRLARAIVGRYDPKKWIVVVSGDLVDHGKTDEFALVREGLLILRRAGFRVYVVPGNHDYGPWGNVYTRAAHTRFLDLAEEIQGIREYPFAVDLDGAALLFLDSTAHDEHGEPFARGRVGARQLAWLESRLANSAHDRAWVVLHHHPIWRNPFLAISDAADLCALVDRRGDRVRYICGHKHAEDLDLVAAGKFTDTGRALEIDPQTGSVTPRDLIP